MPRGEQIAKPAEWGETHPRGRFSISGGGYDLPFDGAAPVRAARRGGVRVTSRPQDSGDDDRRGGRRSGDGPHHHGVSGGPAALSHRPRSVRPAPLCGRARAFRARGREGLHLRARSLLPRDRRRDATGVLPASEPRGGAREQGVGRRAPADPGARGRRDRPASAAGAISRAARRRVSQRPAAPLPAGLRTPRAAGIRPVDRGLHQRYHARLDVLTGLQRARLRLQAHRPLRRRRAGV